MLKLAFGLTFPDLYATDGLARVDASFLAFLRAADAGTGASGWRRPAPTEAALDRGEESALLIAIAPHLEDFVALLFGVEAEVAALQAAQHELAPLYRLQATGRAAQGDEQVQGRRGGALRWRCAARRAGAAPRRAARRLARRAGVRARGRRMGTDEAAHAADIDLALRYAAWAVHTPAGKARHKSGVLFKAPRKLDYLRLIPVEHEHKQRRR